LDFFLGFRIVNSLLFLLLFQAGRLIDRSIDQAKKETMSGAVIVAVAAAIGNLLQGWDNATIAGRSSLFYSIFLFFDLIQQFSLKLIYYYSFQDPSYT